jgi:hypothetical protein
VRSVSLSELEIVFFMIVAVAAIEAWRVRHVGAKLILRGFKFTPTGTGEFLYILGRRSGVLGWLLSLFGLQALTGFSATDNEVARETVGPSGFESVYAPLADIAGSKCSYYRAFWVLVLSLAFYAYGLLSLARAISKSDDDERQSAMAGASYTLWGCLLCGTLLYLWYALSKRVVISVWTKGGVSVGISFKRGVVENRTIELKVASEVVDSINGRLLGKKQGSSLNAKGGE